MERFYVRMHERRCLDAQELAAMLSHRLRALQYHEALLRDNKILFGFAAGDDCVSSILLYAVSGHEELDWLIKRDPHFAYTACDVVPVVTTEALVREAQDFLGEHIFPAEELPKLNFPTKLIRPDGEYWLAWKEVSPFSPLCSEEVQNDVHRRTILAQRGHFENLEFADYNPVGRPVGILIGEGELKGIREHVETCDVFPDTRVEYTRLWTHKQAWNLTCEKLKELRRPAPDTIPFS